jgi:excisionase family DNA binding protein
MSDEWLASRQAAEALGCSVETVRAMLRNGLLSGKKVNGQWRVKAVEVERIQSMKPSAPVPEPLASSALHKHKVDPGMVEVSIALAGVATAIAAFLPGITGVPEILKLIVATVSSAVALLSAYGALWLLARYCLPRYCLTGESLLGIGESLSRRYGIREVWTLLKNSDEIGPYKFIVGGLLFLLLLSVFVGIFAFVR